MLDHMGFAVSDLARSKPFYAPALAPLGFRLTKEIPQRAVGFGIVHGPRRSTDPAGEFWIGQGTATPSVHVAFNAATRAEVDAFYTAALAAGGRDNGPPGLRPHYHAKYYAAFVLDPDGYNIEAVCHAQA